MSDIRRPRPLVRALGVAAVVLAIGAGPIVQSASAQEVVGFSGSGTGFALRVLVDFSGLPDAVKDPIETAYGTFRDALPAEAQAQLPESFPFTIDQRLIETLAEMGAAQKAQALLAHGVIDLPDSAEASSTGETDKVATAEKNIPSDELPILHTSVGELLASVAAGPKVEGSGVLSSLSASLEMVSSLFPADLQAAFDGLTASINTALGTAQGTLDGLLDDVATDLVDQVADDETLGGLLDQAGLGDLLGGADPVGDLTTELTNALQLSTITDLLAGDLASVSDLDNDSKVERTAGEVRSHATSKLGSVDVLGLLNASVVDLMSKSKVAGTPGTASNESSCSIADVKVGGTEDGISLDGDSLTVAGTEIPVPTEQIDTVKGVVDSVLDALGVVGDVGLCDKEAEAEDDGTSAAQRVSAFHVELSLAAPDAVGQTISAGDELVRIVIDPTVETSVAAQVASTQPELPRTGTPVVGTILSGLGLAAGTLLIRRRFI